MTRLFPAALAALIALAVPAAAAPACPRLADTVEEFAATFPLIVFEQVAEADRAALSAAMVAHGDGQLAGVAALLGTATGKPSRLLIEIEADGTVCRVTLLDGPSWRTLWGQVKGEPL